MLFVTHVMESIGLKVHKLMILELDNKVPMTLLIIGVLVLVAKPGMLMSKSGSCAISRKKRDH